MNKRITIVFRIWAREFKNNRSKGVSVTVTIKTDFDIKI